MMHNDYMISSNTAPLDENPLIQKSSIIEQHVRLNDISFHICHYLAPESEIAIITVRLINPEVCCKISIFYTKHLIAVPC
jgi:hypothetical protein